MEGPPPVLTVAISGWKVATVSIVDTVETVDTVMRLSKVTAVSNVGSTVRMVGTSVLTASNVKILGIETIVSNVKMASGGVVSGGTRVMSVKIAVSKVCVGLTRVSMVYIVSGWVFVSGDS